MSASSLRKRKPIDPLEQAIETAFAPGRFIYYKAAWSFVDDLREVANKVDKVIESGPERAAVLYETFIAACHEKADEIDDSSGEFGMLVQDLFGGWIKARQTAGAAADETAKLLLAWMEDDPYGFCHDLDRKIVKVLDKDGIEALGRQARAKFDRATGSANANDKRHADYERRHWGGVLKTLLAARRNVKAYVALCEETELGAKDCKVVAEIYRSRRHPNKALDWVERGLDIARSDTRNSFADHELRDMKRALLVKLGRSEDALESAWIEFQEHPSTYGYKELMRYVPPKERKAWHEKAMDASEKGGLSSQIELWMEKKETGRLVARIGKATDEELGSLSHYATEPLARKFERPHPEIASRVFRALGMRIVDARKSKYYAAALGHLERAKKCYERAGLEAEWESLVADVRKRHYRKKSFMAGLERIVSGAAKRREPTFLERARSRWPKRSKR